MKYIKDRFCNSRKTNPSLGAPAQDPFNQWRANCLFLAGCECKGTTSFSNYQMFGEVFFRRSISVCRKPVLKRSLLKASDQSRERASKSALQALRSAIVVTNLQSCIGHFRPPFLWSCECKGTTTFWIHQIFGEVFFSRASSLCLAPIIYM